MTPVKKSNGKYVLHPDAAASALKSSKEDKASLQKELGSVELQSLLLRILLRLERLEEK